MPFRSSAVNWSLAGFEAAGPGKAEEGAAGKEGGAGACTSLLGLTTPGFASGVEFSGSPALEASPAFSAGVSKAGCFSSCPPSFKAPSSSTLAVCPPFSQGISGTPGCVSASGSAPDSLGTPGCASAFREESAFSHDSGMSLSGTLSGCVGGISSAGGAELAASTRAGSGGVACGSSFTKIRANSAAIFWVNTSLALPPSLDQANRLSKKAEAKKALTFFLKSYL